MRGGGGADYLFDDAGEFGADRSVDTLSGGEGNDTILAANGKAARDVIFCGDGRDAVEADRGDEVASDCERVRR
jgi:Ca2+-binding RTX toxin-like protein